MLFKLLLFIYVNNINAFNYYNAFNRRTMLKTTSGILFSNNINLNENYIDEIDDNIIDNKNNKKKLYRNDIYFTGDLNDESCFKLSEAIVSNNNKAMTNDKAENHINLYIQSKGGALLPTLAVVDQIKNSPIPVHTYIRGYTASAATLLSVVGSKRFIYKHSLLMIHGLKFSDENIVADLNELNDMNYNTNLMLSIIKDIYLENTNLNETDLEKMFLCDRWMSSQDALMYNIVDEII
jgi:ATP-dependent protease ClpP protease subunit